MPTTKDFSAGLSCHAHARWVPMPNGRTQRVYETKTFSLHLLIRCISVFLTTATFSKHVQHFGAFASGFGSHFLILVSNFRSHAFFQCFQRSWLSFLAIYCLLTSFKAYILLPTYLTTSLSFIRILTIHLLAIYLRPQILVLHCVPFMQTHTTKCSSD